MFNTVIGIAGGSGSGKTTLAEAILRQFADQSIILLHQDSYYRGLSHLSYEDRDRINFDHPNAFDNDLLVEHVKALKEGNAINMPIYDYKTHTRKSGTISVEPRDIILLEGILILGEHRLRELTDIKIFVDTDADIRFIRRLNRDIKERVRTIDSVIEQYISTVRPMHFEFIEHTKRFADIIIQEGGYNHIAIDMVVSRVESILSNKNRVISSEKGYVWESTQS